MLSNLNHSNHSIAKNGFENTTKQCIDFRDWVRQYKFEL